AAAAAPAAMKKIKQEEPDNGFLTVKEEPLDEAPVMEEPSEQQRIDNGGTMAVVAGPSTVSSPFLSSPLGLFEIGKLSLHLFNLRNPGNLSNVDGDRRFMQLVQPEIRLMQSFPLEVDRWLLIYYQVWKSGVAPPLDDWPPRHLSYAPRGSDYLQTVRELLAERARLDASIPSSRRSPPQMGVSMSQFCAAGQIPPVGYQFLRSIQDATASSATSAVAAAAAAGPRGKSITMQRVAATMADAAPVSAKRRRNTTSTAFDKEKEEEEKERKKKMEEEEREMREEEEKEKKIKEKEEKKKKKEEEEKKKKKKEEEEKKKRKKEEE
ncbi:hypothetical protein PFISCL1PPCAC_23773, partial [Pristionchus fissidentatus]